MKSYKANRGKGESIRIVLIAALMMMAVFLVPAIHSWASEVHGIGTVVSDGSLNVRSGPGKDYESIGKVDSGALVDIVGMDESEEWYKISYIGETGYVSASYIDFEPAEEIVEEDEEEEIKSAEGDNALEEEEEEEAPQNYKLIFGLLGAIVVLFIIILITIKSIKKMDSDDDDDDDYSDDDEEEYEEEEDEYSDEEDEYEEEYEDDEYEEEDDDAYEYQTITIRRPKQSTLDKQKKDDDYLIDIDPSYFK